MNVTLRQRQDTSFLFNSMIGSTGADAGLSGLAGLVSDYNTIKNGSYNKLVKAYYKKMEGDGKDSAASSSSRDAITDSLYDKGSASTNAAKEYKEISSDVSALKKSLKKLSEEGDGDLYADGAGRSGLESAVADFVDSYNSLVKSAGDSSSSLVNSRATTMTGVSAGSFRKLAGIGVTLQENGLLSLDKEKLSTASSASVSNLFRGSNTYGDKIAAYADLIETGASSAASRTTTYSATGVSNKDYSSLFNSMI